MSGDRLSIEANQLTPALAEHGEGAVWLDHRQGVAWLDMHAGRVFQTDPRTGDTTTTQLPFESVACLRPTRSGGFVAAVENRIAIFDSEWELEHVYPWRPPEEDVAFNEGGCDPTGRFYAGTSAIDERVGAGQLIRLEPDGITSTVLEGLTISNGIEWNGRGDQVFFVDSPTRRIDRFAFRPRDGAFSERHTFTSFEEHDGLPDGLTIDTDDNVWVALWGGSLVRCFTPRGIPLMDVHLPVAHVTSCTFGGEDLDELFITTSRGEPPYRPEPGAGALFVCKPGVRGRPVHRFDRHRSEES